MFFISSFWTQTEVLLTGPRSWFNLERSLCFYPECFVSTFKRLETVETVFEGRTFSHYRNNRGTRWTRRTINTKTFKINRFKHQLQSGAGKQIHQRRPWLSGSQRREVCHCLCAAHCALGSLITPTLYRGLLSTRHLVTPERLNDKHPSAYIFFSVIECKC